MASICGAIPPILSLNSAAAESAAAFISRWEVDLRTAARARLFSFNLPADYGADLEQEARLSLLAASRRYADPNDQLIRTVLGHSVLKASLREVRRNGRTIPIEAAEQLADDSQYESYEPALIQRLRNAIKALPSSLQQIFSLLYVKGVNQRCAASLLKVSQPRISNLHKELKARLKAILTSVE
jgi:RNA polymerase sigma factor (sigma-70 family)